MSKYAELSDKCNDENFKKIYSIASGRMDNGTYTQDGIAQPASLQIVK